MYFRIIITFKFLPKCIIHKWTRINWFVFLSVSNIVSNQGEMIFCINFFWMVLYKYCLCFTEVFPDIKNEICFFGYLNGTSFSVSFPRGCSNWHSLKPEGVSSENSHILCMFSVQFWQYCFVDLRSSCCRKFCSSCRHVLHSSSNDLTM